jgi:hypothetical protein
MTLWVFLQNTDFCSRAWEERLYNAIVGVIYCFCFFNLKEGRSRSRAAVFYLVIVTENFVFVAVYGYLVEEAAGNDLTESMCVAGFAIVGAGTALGLGSMLLYYRFVIIFTKM